MKLNLSSKLLALLLTVLFTSPLFADNKVTDTQYAAMLENLLDHSVNEVDVAQIEPSPNTLFVDAREKSEYDVSHIEGAIWAGYDDFDLDRLGALNPNQAIVVYCSVGYRSEKVAEKLLKAGYNNTSNLYGGIFEWVNQGKNVVNKQGETQNVHPYNRKWGRWLKTGKKVYQ